MDVWPELAHKLPPEDASPPDRHDDQIAVVIEPAPSLIHARMRAALAGASITALVQRTKPGARTNRYGRVDPCPGVGCTSNLVAKSAMLDGAEVPAVPVAVFGATPWQ